MDDIGMGAMPDPFASLSAEERADVEKAAKLPAGFIMEPDGLYFLPAPSKQSPNPSPIFVTAPFAVIGEANDGFGNAWGVVLSWQDRDGQRHEWSVPRRLVHADGNTMAAALDDAGLTCAATRRGHDLLKQFIGGVQASRRLLCVDRAGWHKTKMGWVFLMPDGEAIGPAAHDVILQRDHVTSGDAFRVGGTLAEWQSCVARLAVGNHRLVLMMCAALAGPLLDIVVEPGGGVHLHGASQSGKTTALGCAASIWGCPSPEAQLRTWRATANGLEGSAAETTDLLLALDELGQADARTVSEVVYLLANGVGKARARRDGSLRTRRSWRVSFLSTGEIPLAAKLAEGGRRVMAGQDVRLVSLRADAGARLGVFEDLHSRPDARAFVIHLREMMGRYYGTAGRAFLQKLVVARNDDPEGMAGWFKAQQEAFVARHVPSGADGQVFSVAGRFALFAAAGELARTFGVLPWTEGEATWAAGACFEAWLTERGGSGAAEDAAALQQVRAFIEAYGSSRFEEISPDRTVVFESKTTKRAGFRRRVSTRQGESWEYLFWPEAWRSEVCRGLDAKRVANDLIARDVLKPDTDGRPDRKERIPGYGRPRVYVVSGDILGDGSDD